MTGWAWGYTRTSGNNVKKFNDGHCKQTRKSIRVPQQCELRLVDLRVASQEQ
jgi:hypothetical protein